MAEQLNLTASEVIPQQVTSYYKVIMLVLDWEGARISIVLRGEQGERRTFEYEGNVATTLMVALNTANLAIKSLHRRVLERLSLDGRLVGAVSGSPD